MPTENRSSNTEMVSAPREHELKIRQTPLADLLSGLKTGEIRDCSDREFAVGDTVLLREIDEGRDYTGTVARRTITHVQKHYGLPDHLCVLSYGQPAPQPHPEPIAWMVGTAIWRTKEEAERDAAATGLPIVGLGPMSGVAHEQNQGEPVAWMDPSSPQMHATISNEVKQHNLKFGGAPASAVNGYTIPLYTHADPGEVERLRAELVESDHAFVRASGEAEQLRGHLDERDAILRDLLDFDISLRARRRLEEALSAKA